MRVLALLLATVWASSAAAGPAPVLEYTIEARLGADGADVEGRVDVRFHLPRDPADPEDPWIDRVPVHLYWNAFASPESTFSRELARAGDPPDPDTLDGSMKLGDVTQDGVAAPLAVRFVAPDDDNALDRTLAELTLAQPVRASTGFTLHLPFTARVPTSAARVGHTEGWTFAGQWFPKLPVFERRRGFRGYQYHAETEFFADFARYDVTLTVPEGWLVVATGQRLARHHFVADRVHDFAWSAARPDRAVLETHAGGVAEVEVLAPVGSVRQRARAAEASARALAFFSSKLLRYPYPRLTVVVPPPELHEVEGMEYPTLITSLTADPMWESALGATLRIPEVVDIHEVGHQWFYGILATNEHEEAFLDEGLNSYWEVEALRALYGQDEGVGSVLGHAMAADLERVGELRAVGKKLREAISRSPSSAFLPGTFGSQLYGRTAMVVETAQRYFGRPVIDAVFAALFARHAYQHPRLPDVLAVARDVGGAALAAQLEEGLTRPTLPDYRFVAIDERTLEPGDAEDGAVEALCAKPEVSVFDPGGVDGVERWGARNQRYTLEVASSGACRRTEVRFEGPGWATLPTEIELVFDDGTRARVPWAGRSAWVAVSVIAHASVVEARIDPDQRVALDAWIANDGHRVEPERTVFGELRLFGGALLASLAGLAGLLL